MNTTDMPLRATKCATCPFREGSKYEYLKGGLIDDRGDEAGTICHSTGSNNAINHRTGFPPHLCRGMRDHHIEMMHDRGTITAPTDEAWDDMREICGLKRTVITDPVKNSSQFTIEMGQFYTAKDFPKKFRELLLACHHSGACDEEVKLALPYFKVDDPSELRTHLKKYGTWDTEELSDDKKNLGRLLWLMASDLHEQGETYTGE